jgi:hypothetical protein
VDNPFGSGDHEGLMAKQIAAPVGLDLEDVRRCTELLETLVADRALLAEVPLEMRQALLIAAGRLSRPESHQEKRLVRALRRGGGSATRPRPQAAPDRHPGRPRSPVFVAPGFATPARALPVCRRAARRLRRGSTPGAATSAGEYTRLHHFYDACPRCADLNYAKRSRPSLEGRVGLVQARG